MLSPRGEDLTSSLTTSAIAPRTSGDGAVRWTGDPIQAHVSPMRGDPVTNDSWSQAIDRMLARVQDTMVRVKEGFPHWADPETGRWTTTPDGDWTGGYWIGMLWLAATATGDARYRAGGATGRAAARADQRGDGVQVLSRVLRRRARGAPPQRSGAEAAP